MRPASSPAAGARQDGHRAPIIGPWGAPPALSLNKTDLAAQIQRLVDWTGFVLLFMAIGTLLFRPAELFPSLAGQPLYEFLMIACILASAPRLMERLTPRALRENAVITVPLLLVPAVMASHLSHADLYDARIGGLEMFKASLLFLLVVSLVTTPARLQAVLAATTAGVFAMTALVVLQYHGTIYIPGLANVVQGSLNPDEGPAIIRLCGVGVFNDPNDLALILVVAMVVCVYGLGEKRLGMVRPLLLLPLALFGHALILTHSRGGLLSALGALLAFLPARLGWKNALPIFVCLLAGALVMPSWGRETSIDLANPEDTFQTRLGLWSDSLQEFRSAPIFGIGQDKLYDAIGAVAHNSFVHAFAELGLLGGTAFIGAFYLGLRGLWRAQPLDRDVARLRPYLLASIAGYAVGLLSLSRCYTVPTQLILALATSGLSLAAGRSQSGIPRFDLACARRVAVVGLVFLGAVYVFLRVMLQKGAS